MGSQSKKLSVRELCYIGIFTVLIVVCAQINIPLPGGVPFTLQVWAISLAGLVLGSKNGTIATVVYILLGAFGVPVFARFTGGFGIIAGVTGGFILSFPILAFLAGLGGSRHHIAWSFPALVVGNVFNLTVGLFWFHWITGFSLALSFAYSVAPFLIVTVVQIAVVPLLARSIKFALRKAGVSI
ncbi:MAG: biotin transporter BioY [Oscillospiraceae bacterium]|nr:biotin transporter BioY [Oscillospiraceae bacterium]